MMMKARSCLSNPSRKMEVTEGIDLIVDPVVTIVW